jgi:NAD kinase
MDRVVLVTKKTALEELVLLHMTEGAARFALESVGTPFEPYLEEDAAYQAALKTIQQQVPNDLPLTIVTREELPNFFPRENDLIIVCGPDGLFVNAAKYLDGQPVLTVNPDPRAVAGKLMLFPPAAVGKKIADIQAGEHRVERLPFAKAVVDDDQVVWGVNDIFVGRRDQASARYSISFDHRDERHSSSGIIISTGVGSTGWLRSVATMVAGLGYGNHAGKLSSLPSPTNVELVFVVREPFSSPATGTSIITGRITPGTSFAATSEMSRGGYVFSDGVIEKGVEWSAGSTVVVTVGERYVERVVP